MTQLVVNGNAYSDDGSTPQDMRNGGHRKYELPMISDAMIDMAARLAASIVAQSAAAASQVLAAASAASAISSPGTSATSTTSATIATGTVVLNVQPGKSFVVGASVKAAVTASPSNWMHGDILAYNTVTGDLTINAMRIQGSGTSAAWTIGISGPAFADGAIGGSYVAALSADLALTAASPKLLSLAVNIGGLSYIQPDATTLAAGPFAQTVKHTGPQGSFAANDILSKDHAGTLLGFLQPFSTATYNLSDNTSAAGIWSVSGLSPIGSLAAGRVNLASACGGTGGTWTKNITIDATHTLILIYGTSLHAVVYDSSAKQFGAPVLLRATLSTTGVDATVAAVLVAANTVLVHSVQDGTTALQSVVLSISGKVINPGTMVPTTLGATAARIVDLITVGSAYVLGYMNGTTALRTIATTVSGTVPTLGAEQTNATVGPPALIAWSSTVFTAVTISATAITARAWSISGVTQTVGSIATCAVTTVDSFALRGVSTGNWCVTFINSGAKGSVLSVSGTAPAFSAQVALSSAVTTINPGGVVANFSTGSSGNVAVATSGTDSSGRFVTEFMAFGDTGSGTAVLVGGSIVAKGFAAAQTAVAISNLSSEPIWQVTSAKETALFSFSNFLNNNLLCEYRTNAVANFAQELSAPDPLYPKINIARNTLGAIPNSNSVIGVTDGSQLSLKYVGIAAYVELLNKPVNVCADMRFASKAANDSQAWVAFNQAPDTGCAIQLVGVV